MFLPVVSCLKSSGWRTFLCILVYTNIQVEYISRQAVFLWETLDYKHQLFLANSLKTIRAQTPALLLTIYNTNRETESNDVHQMNKWNMITYFKSSSDIVTYMWRSWRSPVNWRWARRSEVVGLPPPTAAIFGKQQDVPQLINLKKLKENDRLKKNSTTL